MKRILSLSIAIALIATACTTGNKTENPVKPVDEISLSSVTIDDSFWTPRIDNNYMISVMEMLNVYESNERAPDPKLAEAVGYLLQTYDDPALRARMDEDIEKLIARVLPGGKPREWKNLLNGEMYSAGHLMEAAVAYHEATGNQKVLDAAIRVADDIDDHFGQGKRLDVSQHEEVKIGLLKLYHATGDEKYLNLARFFLDERGRQGNGRELYGEYAQDHKPVVEQEEAVGHTVRATYLYTPLAELAAITNDPSYISAADRLWNDAALKTYITGSIGTYRDHEDYGEQYELPNLSCWNETCASIGNVFWNYRMFSLHRDAKYIDMLENVLYNGFLSGVSLDGSKYFYQNPLKTFGGFERQPWFGPNCCPPNVVRLIASLGRYIYAKSDDNLYVNLFIGSTLNTEIGNSAVSVKQETRYPWEGDIKLTVTPEQSARFTVHVRIPGWAGTSPMPGGLYQYLDNQAGTTNLMVNGKLIDAEPVNGYVSINRTWKRGDVIELELPLDVRRVISHEKVADNAGMIALRRGPLVYCAEGVDNGGSVMNIYLPDDASFNDVFREDILDGVVAVEGKVKRVARGEGKTSTITGEADFVAIPYYAWANRGNSDMSVWLPRNESGVLLPPAPTIASTSRISSSCGSGSLSDNYPGGKVPSVAARFYPSAQSGSAGFAALYDQVEPVNSFDGSSTYLALRPQSGDRAWVQYDFNEKATVSSVDVYWKDDKQYCLSPETWQLLYRSGNRWVPVKNLTDYTVDRDRFNTLAFEPVTTDGLRLEIKLRGQLYRKGELGPPDGNYMPGDVTWYETGIIEWRVSK